MNDLVPWITLIGGVGVSVFVAVTGFLDKRAGVKGRQSELQGSNRRDTVADRDSLIETLQEERDREHELLEKERRYTSKLRRQIRDELSAEPHDRD